MRICHVRIGARACEEHISNLLEKYSSLYSLAGIAFYVVSYSVLYTDVNGGWIGTFNFFYNSSQAELNLLNTSVGDATGAAKEALEKTIATASKEVIGSGYSVMSDWFFQMVCSHGCFHCFRNIGRTHQSLAVPNFRYFDVCAYPNSSFMGLGRRIWLSEMGFSDFAGSTLVHSTCALGRFGWCNRTWR